MIVVASHLPGEGHFRSRAYRVVPVLCIDPLDYWRGLAAVWDHAGSLINIEHDMEVTDAHIAELEECPHPLCTFAYASHWVTTHQRTDVYSHRIGDRYITEGVEWCEKSAIGLCKLTLEQRSTPLAPRPWSHVEESIEAVVTPPWHVHWPPVTHHHW